MNIIKGINVYEFNHEDINRIVEIKVPQGSKILKAKCLFDGIHIWFEMPAKPPLAIIKSDTDPITVALTTMRFKVLIGVDPIIPKDAVLIDILDTIMEDETGKQSVAILPFYQLK